MKNKKLVLLVAAAVLLAVLAYLSNNKQQVKAPSMVGKLLLPDLDLSKIARIEGGTFENKKLVLESTDEGWVVSSLYNFPAEITKIRSNLLILKDLKAGHVASGKTLEEPVLIDLQDSAGKSLATLRMGETHTRQSNANEQMGYGGYPDGRFVAAGESVVLVNNALEAFDGDPKNWINTQISEISSTESEALELTQGSQTVKLTKKDGSWTVEGLGEEEEFDNSKIYGTESSLSYLNFTSIADPELDAEALGMNTSAVYRITLNTGLSYTADIGGKSSSNDRYFKVKADFAPRGTNELENAELQKKADDFNARSTKWVYTISAYNADNMTRGRADFVKAKEKKEEKKEEKDKAAAKKEE